ncbi:MAG TPA: galactokinase [Solirubrobacteraceae bacterium]|nr:galactokinase [Solirubrobacteraceae bacterium]
MSVISTRAPLRLSLGGGGTDLPSYYREHGGFLVAGAIDKYVYILMHTVFQRRFRMKYSEFEEVDTASEIRHPLLREAITRHWDGNPIEIASIADVPAGTGLGSSGAYTVCLLKALALGQRLSTTPASLAESACEIEIEILGEPVGKQDQYVAAHGGICAYTFSQDGGVEVRPLRLAERTRDALSDNFLLFYTGAVRSASAILSDQTKRTEAGDKSMTDNLHRTKELGYQSCELLEQGELERYARMMHEHWETKRKRSPGMSNERIDDLYSIALEAGALGGKLVGAGGGGFLLVYSERPDATRAAMAGADAQELRFEFEFQGCVGSEFR